MSFSLRLASLNDVADLNDLIPLSVRSLQAAHYTSAQREGALGTVFGVDLQLIRDGTYYVAEEEGRIVGCGGWSRRKSLFGANDGQRGVDPLLDPKTEAARIRAFFVHPAFARRGIGKALMAAAETAAINAGFSRIDIVATLAGEPLYLGFGYTVVRRYELDLLNGEKLPVVHLTRKVSPPSVGVEGTM